MANPRGFFIDSTDWERFIKPLFDAATIAYAVKQKCSPCEQCERYAKVAWATACGKRDQAKAIKPGDYDRFDRHAVSRALDVTEEKLMERHLTSHQDDQDTARTLRLLRERQIMEEMEQKRRDQDAATATTAMPPPEPVARDDPRKRFRPYLSEALDHPTGAPTTDFVARASGNPIIKAVRYTKEKPEDIDDGGVEE